VSARYGVVFGGVRRLLDAQVERLSPVEYDVLRRLAVEREPISLAELSHDIALDGGWSTVVEQSRQSGVAHWWSEANADHCSHCTRWCSNTRRTLARPS
jgi:hypothetical protein